MKKILLKKQNLWNLFLGLVLFMSGIVISSCSDDKFHEEKIEPTSTVRLDYLTASLEETIRQQ